MIRHLSLCFTVFILLANLAGGETSYDPDSHKVPFTSLETTWHDDARDRDVPVKIYYPVGSTGNLPVIIFSHGLGGSRAGYGYLGQYWAAHGYVSVHLTHLGSDTQAITADGLENLKQTGQAIVKNPMNAVNRCKDVSFAIDQLAIVNDDVKSPLHALLDLSKIGMAGHSFGANTTMLIARETTISGKTNLADSRITCAIALCPPVPTPKPQWDKAYSTVKIPLFVMTGTKDDSPIGDTTAAQRRVPFDHVKDIPAYLITLDGADHMVFGGNRSMYKQPNDDRFHQLIQQGSVAFWDAYLREDESAKTWLKDGRYAKAVGALGVFEEK